MIQKSLSRKQKQSKNYERTRQKLAKLHEKISNQRKDFLHKLSSKITHENQVIVLEENLKRWYNAKQKGYAKQKGFM